MNYRCEATSVAGFVQQIACSYLRHGYWWYATGVIPERKDPICVDVKLVDRYEIDLSEWKRSRRKHLGYANMHYLRYGRFFVLLATQGRHEFFEAERSLIRDFRRVPLRFAGYSISYRRGGRTRRGEPDPKWHAHVEIERRHYNELKSHFLCRATHRSVENLAREFGRIPYEPYAPIRRQLLNILRSVNRARKHAGYELVPPSVLRLRRRIVKPFEPVVRRDDAVVDTHQDSGTLTNP
jgi:hypothetical protein